jgi:pimeloyl-ACP methyl ester carboxylesterase
MGRRYGESVSTFALVHGAWHGAWCWERLTPELEARGHRVVAPDLPSDDPAATFITYADVVEDSLAGEVDVVLVGHSLAGNTVPLVAARRPVSRIVYLCAVVPIPERSFNEQSRIEPDTFVPGYQAGLTADDEGRSSWVDEDIARHTFFADCDERDARAAFRRLRPQSMAPYDVPCPIDAFPAAPRTYVLCTEDRIVNPDWSRRVARERLDAELVELPGSHSPFLSRPAALAEVLCRS